MRSLTATILSDNRAAAPLAAEHGFSVLLEWTEKSESEGHDQGGSAVLFDTGRGTAFENAAALGLDLSRLTAVVLSHGHYDHTDALARVLELSPRARVYASAVIGRPHFSAKTGSIRDISLSASSRAALREREESSLFTPVQGILPVVGTPFWVSAPIVRTASHEVPSPLLFSDAEGHIPDTMSDELVLYAPLSDGLFILTGCCHAGPENTLRHVRALSGVSSVHTFMGGFHLAGLPDERLGEALSTLRTVSRAIPCHCTGEAELEKLVRILPETGTVCTAGYAGFRCTLP